MLAMANSMAAPSLSPEMLLAAKRGNWTKLDDLMRNEGALSPQVTVDIDIEGVGVHYGPDTVLHVVAASSSSFGGGEETTTLMKSFCDKAKHFLGARNARGDTPLHCAARAGNTEMVSHLIDLARRHDDDGGTALLRKENKRGETVLHEAIRRANAEMVQGLMAADGELARFPRNGVSPLYLAILLGHYEIAQQLYQKDNQLSYSGPDGQNAMHIAVLTSERMTKKLLEWNQSLIKQGDRIWGSTPQHYVGSWGTAPAAKLLLDAYESSAYQSDDKGSFPIHVAAFRNNGAVIEVLLEKCPDCAELQDAEGRTILHIAALNGYHDLVSWIAIFLQGNPKDACAVQRFASTMNMQDNQGNTAVHYAAKSRSLRTTYCFIWYRQVRLNIQNNEGKTALDLAIMTRPPGLLFALDSEVRILNVLGAAGARAGFRPRGEEDEDPKPNVDKEAEKIKDSTATIGIASVLIITVSFALAFQFPGGYSSGDDNRQPGGTPELAKVYSFEAFMVANILAAFCSAISTFSVMLAGVSTVSLYIRQLAFVLAVFFLNSSARSLAAAFAFGTYAVLAPVARAAAILTWVLTSFLVADIALVLWVLIRDQNVLLNRRGWCQVWLRSGAISVGTTLLFLWPYVVIAGFLAYIKVFGIH